MMPSISIAGLSLPSYAVMTAIGIVICILVFFRSGATFTISFRELYMGLLSMLPWGFIFSTFVGYITKIPYFIENDMHFPVTILYTGIVFYGGLLGGLFGLKVYLLGTQERYLKYTDTLCRLIPIGHAFGRVGCYLGGCCYGREYTGLFSVLYPVNGIHISVFPVQLFEAAGELVLGIFLLTYKSNKEGQYTYIYLLTYAVMRFFLEFMRGDSIRGIWLHISTSQWISLGVIMVICLLKAKNKFRQAQLPNDNKSMYSC